MAFSTFCTNKNCGKHQEPYINQKDDKVYCSCCDREITNITYFAKAQMKSAKQYKQKQPASFSVKCNKCGVESRPQNIKDKIVCGSCSKELDNLSVAFKNMLKDKLKTAGKDI
jgi:hypothetical protein